MQREVDLVVVAVLGGVLCLISFGFGIVAGGNGESATHESKPVATTKSTEGRTLPPSAHELLGLASDEYNPTLRSRWVRKALAYKTLVAFSESKQYPYAIREVEVYDDDYKASYVVKGRIDYDNCWLVFHGFDELKCFRIIFTSKVFDIIDGQFVLNGELTADVKINGSSFE